MVLPQSIEMARSSTLHPVVVVVLLHLQVILARGSVRSPLLPVLSLASLMPAKHKRSFRTSAVQFQKIRLCISESRQFAFTAWQRQSTQVFALETLDSARSVKRDSKRVL